MISQILHAYNNRNHSHRRPRQFTRLQLESLEDRRMLAITVDSFLDPSEAGRTTLRDAIIEANSTMGQDTINFAPSMSGQTILLTNGDLPVTDSLIIDASLLTNTLTIDADMLSASQGGNDSRIFHVNEDAGALITFELKNMILINGKADGFGVAAQGGAIRAVNTSLTLTNVTVQDNQSAGDGGAIYVTTTDVDTHVTIDGGKVSDNTASGSGGGIYFQNFPNPITGPEASLIVMNKAVIENNGSGNSGGGIHFLSSYKGSMTVDDAKIENNTAIDGGGIFVDSVGTQTTVTVQNLSTISGNTAESQGGGIRVAGVGAFLDVAESTISGNSAIFGQGGGIAMSDISGPTKVKVKKSELSGNSAGTDGGGLAVQCETQRCAESVLIEDSTFDNNTATNEGGGAFISVGGPPLTAVPPQGTETPFQLTIRGTTFSNNRVITDDPVPIVTGVGGGLWFCVKWAGNADIENSTFSGNQAETGGGIALFADDRGPSDLTATFRNVTITENNGDFGGGLHIMPFDPDADMDVVLHNTIIDHNRDVAGQDASNITPELSGGQNVNTTTSSNNLLGHTDPDQAGTAGGLVDGFNENIIDAGNDPKLAPLGDNGGPTRTHEPLAISAAVDAGNNSEKPPVPGGYFDQRGNPYIRAWDSGIGTRTVDIGAVELQPLLPVMGDMDLDGDVDFDDIAPFALGLNDPAAYLATYGVPSYVRGDMDGDGDHDFDDIPGFVAALGGTSA